jgi:hypothetical protein
VLAILFKSFRIVPFVENPLIAGFVERQYEAKTGAWSGKTTEGQANPSNCYKSAKIRYDEDITYTPYDPCFMKLWNLVSNFSSESIFICNFNVGDDI